MKKIKLFCACLISCGIFATNVGATTTSLPAATPVATSKSTATPKSSATPKPTTTEEAEKKLPKLPKKITLCMGQEYVEFPKLKKNKIDYTLTSSNVKIVEVVGSSKMHAIQQGKATIFIETKYGTHKCKITVKKKGFAYPNFVMLKGEILPLSFTNEEKASTYHWKSSNVKVAKVSKTGLVTAKSAGSAYIVGVSKAKRVACKLNVKKKPKKIIYLTFDDGPSRSSTPKILSILKKNSVKATFFELKPAVADFDLTKKILSEGHTLALHGYSHKYDQIYRSESIYHNNLDSLRNLFFQKFGVWCTLSRFPGGSSNTVSRYNHGIMSRLSKSIHGWGYRYYDWNVSSGDAGGATNPNQVYRNITHSLHAGSNVVLMHDFPNNTKTINALNRVIKYGKKHGYTFLPLSASTTEVHHPINN